ncbi:hypothetical protein SEA_REYNAULD_99 [Rhodococcus phage Reynauld]|uniref:Uncharacterized protein n=1 Tax=Rhodococcus phage Reynauld TaxID=3062845 RepID=A0ACD4UJB8_9CAUD|nr:hypothetical protein SEA_REYNAULD_99 [Rhodococcus phage Reynauld]
MSHNTITGADVQAIAWQADSFGQYANDLWVAEYADAARAAALDALGNGTDTRTVVRRVMLALPDDYDALGWTCYADAVRGVYDADGADTVGSTDDTEREITDLLESLGYSLDWDNGPMIYDTVRARASSDWTAEHVQRAAEYWRVYGEVIDDATARAIAAQWQSSGAVGSDLATLASGIRIDRRAAVADVDATLANLEADGVNLDTETPSARGEWTAEDYVALHALRAWILAAPSASGTLAN